MIFIMPATLAFSVPQHSLPSINSPLDISINTTSGTEVYMKKIHEVNYSSFALSGSPRASQTIPSTFFDTNGVYVYYFKNATARFPDQGYFSFSVTNRSSQHINFTQSFIANDQSTAVHCQPHQNDFSCSWAHMQLQEAQNYAWDYWATANQTSLTFTRNFLTNSTGIYDAKKCDPVSNDFNCTSLFDGGYFASGARRQGLSMAGAANIALLTGNPIAYSYAESYGQGVTPECNVWLGDVTCNCSNSGPNNECSAANNQGAMILGYTALYQLTGNQSYKTIAGNLADNINGNSLLALEGLARYASIDPSKISAAETMAAQLQHECVGSGCDSREHGQALRAFQAVYELTGNIKYLDMVTKIMVTSPSTDCDIWSDDYSCSNSEEQALYRDGVQRSSLSIPATKNIIVRGFESLPRPSINNTLRFMMQGLMRNLSMTWTSSSGITQQSFPINGSFYLNAINIDRYVVSFNDSLGRIGTWGFIVPDADQLLTSVTKGFALSDPSDVCDPFGSNPSTPDYNCVREHAQGWMLQGLSEFYWLTNSSAERTALSSPLQTMNDVRIDTDASFVQSTCEYVDQDYICDYTHPTNVADPFKARGAIRQAKMIDSFLSLYNTFQRPKDLYKAKNYLHSYAGNECNASSGDFNCNSDSQGFIASAYWKAYEVLGERMYFDYATQFSDVILSYTPSEYTPYAGIALWDSYEHTKNPVYLQKATNITSHFEAECIINDCTVKQLGEINLLLWTAIENNATEYFDSAYTSTLLVAPTEQDSCDPSREDTVCSRPSHQGLFTNAMVKATSSYLVPGNKTYAINITAPSSAQYQENISIRCDVQNTANISSSFELYFISDFTIEGVSTTGTPIDGGKRIRFSSVPKGENRSVNWTLNADYGGEVSHRCSVSNFQNSTTTTVNNISSVIDFKITPMYNPVNYIKTYTATLKNNVSFPLTNVTLNISTPAQVVSVNTSIQSTNTHPLRIPEIIGNQSLTITYRLRPLVAGSWNTSFLFDTKYGGAINVSTNLTSYNDTMLGYNFSNVSSAQLNTVQPVSWLIKNTNNISMNNVTISIVKSDELIINNVSFSGNNISQINATTFHIDDFSGSYNFTWNVYGSVLQNQSYLYQLSQPEYTYQSSNFVFEVFDDIITLNSTLSPSNQNEGETTPSTLTLSAINTGSFNLNNLRFIPTFGGVVSFSSLSTNNTFTQANSAVLENTSYNNSAYTAVLNVTDNNNLTIELSNSTASITTVWDTNRTKNLTYVASNNGSVTYILSNGSTSCTSCLLSGQINLTMNGTGTVTVDSIMASYNTQVSQATGVVDNQTAVYSVAQPNTLNLATWSVSLQRPGTFSINVTSDEGLRRLVSFTVTETEVSSSGGSGGGGGGGSFPAISARYIVYNYSNYSYCDYDEECNDTIANFTDSLRHNFFASRFLNDSKTKTNISINTTVDGVCTVKDVFNGTVLNASGSFLQSDLVRFTLTNNITLWYNTSRYDYKRPIIRCIPPTNITEVIESENTTVVIPDAIVPEKKNNKEPGTATVSIRSIYANVYNFVMANLKNILIAISFAVFISLLITAKKRGLFQRLSYVSISFSPLIRLFKKAGARLHDELEYERSQLRVRMENDIFIDKSYFLAAPPKIFDFIKGKSLENLLGEVYFNEKKMLSDGSWTEDEMLQIGVGVSKIMSQAHELDNKAQLRNFLHYTINFAKKSRRLQPDHAHMCDELVELCEKYFMTPKISKKSSERFTFSASVHDVKYDVDSLFIDMKRLLYHAQQGDTDEVKELRSQIQKNIHLIKQVQDAHKRSYLQSLYAQVHTVLKKY